MLYALLLGMMLFQAAPASAPKPAIDNDRVTVWDGLEETASAIDAKQIVISN